MKKKAKFTVLISALLTFCILAVALGAQFKPYAFPLIGRWQPTVDPLLIEDYGFQDIQNLRKDNNKLKGVSGHSAINSTVWNTTNLYPRNGFHFRKYQPSESHVIITATDTSEANPNLFQNTTAIPSAGDFATTAEILYTEDTSAGLGRFANATQGNVVYTNGAESLIWGGDELVIAGFDVYNPDGSFTYNYYDQVSNSLTSSGNVATITPSDATIDSYTKLLLHCDGSDAGTNFDDSGDTGHADTAAGDAQLDTDYQKFGSAAGLFDGAGDYVTFPDHADWTLGTAEFTIDAWLKIDDLTSERAIVSQLTDDGNYWEFLVDTDGSIDFIYMEATSSEYTIEVTTAASVLSTGTEYHVAVSRDLSGNFYIFKNGELQKSANDTDAVANLTGDLHVGILNKAAQEDDYDGWIDELRVTNGASRWTSNFEPPTSAYSGTGKAYFRVGSPRPLQGFKLYVGTANTAASTMTVYYWNGSSLTAVSSLSDGTATGGASLAQTGSVTFTSTVGSAKPKLINGLQLYWYKVEISACDSTTTVTQATIDAPMQAMTNLWSSTYLELASAYVYEDSVYKDYTDELQDDTTAYFAVLDSLATSESLILGFTESQQGINLRFIAGKENTTNSVLTVSYWSGAAWTSVSGLTDGTATAGVSLAKSGIVSFEPVSAGSEFQRDIEQELPLYYYKLSWDAALDAEVEMYHVEGIPAPSAIPGYKFPALFQSRTFLFVENSKAKNKALYSAYNTPFVFNGSDSGSLYFGDESEIAATATIYNVYQTSGLEQLIVFKNNETWRLYGDGPDNWIIQEMSGNIGCIAPLSVAVAEVSDIAEGIKRQVVIFQSASGVYQSDGATIQRISDDIDNYWDPNSSDYIPTSRMDNSVGWYNPNLQSYKLLISSGSGQTTHNVELEYSLKYREWTKIYRENGSGAYPLQVGFPVVDTVGNVYTYGATNDAYMWRLENGTSWNGTAIAQYVWTKDILMDNEMPFFKSTVVKYFRMLYETKTGTAEVAIAHYCDGSLTTDGSSNQAVPDAVDITSSTRSTADCNLGPCLKHSFKLSTSPVGVTDGMELTGLGFLYDTIQTIQE